MAKIKLGLCSLSLCISTGYLNGSSDAKNPTHLWNLPYKVKKAEIWAWASVWENLFDYSISIQSVTMSLWVQHPIKMNRWCSYLGAVDSTKAVLCYLHTVYIETEAERARRPVDFRVCVYVFPPEGKSFVFQENRAEFAKRPQISSADGFGEPPAITWNSKRSNKLSPPGFRSEPGSDLQVLVCSRNSSCSPFPAKKNHLSTHFPSRKHDAVMQPVLTLTMCIKSGHPPLFHLHPIVLF